MKSKKILVVEDERLVAEDISECLRSAGYEVCGIANNGAKALELAAQHRPDLILEDIVIQGDMDGIEVSLRMKNDFGIPTVFLTAYSQEGILERAQEAEPLGFIIKPFDESSLLSTVQMALHKSLIDTQLRESEEWFSTTLNSIGDGVIATDSTGEIQFMNRLAGELTQWSDADAEGEHIEDVFQIFQEEPGEKVDNPALLAMVENEVKSLPNGCVLKAKDGTQIPIDDSGAPIHDSTGEIIGSVLVFRDVSEQREAERKVREYQSRLEELVEIRTEALKRRIKLEKLNNDLASRLLGSDCEDFYLEMGKGLGKIVRFLGLSNAGVYKLSPENADISIPLAVYTADSEEQERAMQEQHGASGVPWFSSELEENGQLVLNSVDDIPADAVNEKRMLADVGVRAIVLLPLRNESSIVISFASNSDREWSEQEVIGLRSVATVIQNSIERQQAEAERKLLQDQLHQAQKLEAIGKLTGGIAHDFNNMLVPIIGYADSILEEAGSIEYKEEISEIRRAAASAASLTRQLLAFSRKQILDKKPLRINSEIRDVERMIKRMLGEDIVLTIEAGAEQDIVEADRGQLHQILVNLCVNARDAMPLGGSITISTWNPPGDDSNVIITVTDTGTGMSPEVQEKAFDPFFSTKGMDGTGLGLSVVMGIVHQHNGEMQLTSEHGVGTSFTITLPVIQDTELKTAKTKTRNPVLNNRGKGIKILLVEDEPAVMTFVKMALSRKGFEVIVAENKSKAIKIFDEHNGEFNMIFTDAKLPDGTGIDVLEYVHGKNPNMKALISSGYTDDRALLDQARARGVMFLQKPYPLDELFRFINKVLNEGETEAEVDLVLPG